MWAIKITLSDKTQRTCQWSLILLSLQPEVPLVWSLEFYRWHYLKFVWDASWKHVIWWEVGQQTPVRTVTEHTAVKSSCQSDLRHGAINQQVLERTWKQESRDGRVNTASLLSSESVGLGPEGEEVRGLRSGLTAATGSSSRDLHVSDRPTGGKCKCSSTTYIELVSSVSFCVWVYFFLSFFTLKQYLLLLLTVSAF